MYENCIIIDENGEISNIEKVPLENNNI